MTASALAAPSRAQADGYSFTKGPYLQGLTTHSVIVRWEGNPPVGGTVVITGPEGGDGGKPLSREVRTAEEVAFHSVEVSGLQPDTTYSYVVKTNGVTSPEGHFTTAPEVTRPFSFLVYGDNRSQERAHEAVVKAMLRAPGELLLHTGDMVLEGGDDDAWDTFFQIEAPLLRDRCLFAAVGNHELLGHGEPVFLRYFHPAARGDKTLYYSVRWSSARFFLVNAQAAWDGGDGAADKAWLEAELTRADDEPGLEQRFVLMHHSPYSSGPHGDNGAFLRAGLAEVLRKHRVTMVFAGHDHIYERGEKDGVRYIISGGGGAPLYPRGKRQSAATQVFESAHHFVEGKIDGKVVTTIARRVDGSVMESCTLSGSGDWACQGLPHVPPAPTSPPPATPSGRKKSCDCSVPGAASFPGDGLSGGAAIGFLAALALRSRLRRRREIS